MSRDIERRSRAAAVHLSFLVSAAAFVALAVAYVLGGQPQAEGALLFVGLGGLAVGFALWAHHFLPGGPEVQERAPLPSPPAQRQAVARAFERDVGRRSFVRTLALALAALGAALVFPIRSLGPAPGRALLRTSWRRGSRLVTGEGTVLTVDALPVGSMVTVFPEGHAEDADSQTVLVRTDPARLRLPPGRERWSPEGYVAYSKLCTHAGCPVGLYEQQTDYLYCPCHQSIFDALEAARPIAGPATRPLPQLPISVDEQGFLVADSDFHEPVGPSFWQMPVDE